MKFVLALSLALFAAVQPATAAVGFNITDIVRASDADLNAAIADATANNDTFAVQCYSGILAYNAANPKKPLTAGKPVGVVSAFQTSRDIVKGIQNPADLIPKDLVAACGALALDVQGDIARAAPTFLGLRF